MPEEASSSEAIFARATIGCEARCSVVAGPRAGHRQRDQPHRAALRRSRTAAASPSMEAERPANGTSPEVAATSGGATRRKRQPALPTPGARGPAHQNNAPPPVACGQACLHQLRCDGSDRPIRHGDQNQLGVGNRGWKCSGMKLTLNLLPARGVATEGVDLPTGSGEASREGRTRTRPAPITKTEGRSLAGGVEMRRALGRAERWEMRAMALLLSRFYQMPPMGSTAGPILPPPDRREARWRLPFSEESRP